MACNDCNGGQGGYFQSDADGLIYTDSGCTTLANIGCHVGSGSLTCVCAGCDWASTSSGVYSCFSAPDCSGGPCTPVPEFSGPIGPIVLVGVFLLVAIGGKLAIAARRKGRLAQ